MRAPLQTQENETHREREKERETGLVLSKYCLRAFKQCAQEWFRCCKTAYRDELAGFGRCAPSSSGKSTHRESRVEPSVEANAGQTKTDSICQRVSFWFHCCCFSFSSATNYNLFDRNSAKYKNINNDIMWFLLLLVSWDRCISPALFFLFYGLLQPSFSFSSFCLTFISATRKSRRSNDLNSEENKKYKSSAKCSVNTRKENVQKTITTTSAPTTDQSDQRMKLQVQFLAAFMMNRWASLCPSRRRVLFSLNALVYTNKKRFKCMHGK